MFLSASVAVSILFRNLEILNKVLSILRTRVERFLLLLPC